MWYYNLLGSNLPAHSYSPSAYKVYLLFVGIYNENIHHDQTDLSQSISTIREAVLLLKDEIGWGEASVGKNAAA